MKIKSIKVIKGKNKWSESKTKLIHMVLDLGEFEQKPSNKIDGFYERIKKHLPSLKSHRCSIGKPGGFFQRIKEGTWMGHIIEHVALELQTLAGYDTGWGRTRGVKGQKGVYNVVFNFENEECGKLAAKEAFNVVNDIINDKDPQIDKIVKKLESKTLIESIRRILREEDFIPLEDLNTVIKDYEDGFDVFIMNGDKKIGEISFAKEDKPDQYTIVDATIDDEYKGNRIYPKTIINLFKERPNLIINSVFRSPDAEKAWIYLLSNLPSNIGKSVKYYKDEDTTLFQLKLRNIQESIKKILREELNESAFFFRRINLDKVEKLLPINAEQVYGETKSYEQFKYELTLRAVEAIMWNDYELGWEDLPEQEEIEFVNKVSNMFNKTIKKLYNSYNKK